MAKLFVKVTRRPVGCPESVQLPVSSNTVWNIPSSTTSPVTPLISTQSPRRIPFLPINTNQPRKPTMKSLRHSEAGACQPQNRTELTWGAEDDQQNEEYRENLQRNAGNSAQRLHLAPVERCPSQQIFEPPIKEHADQQHAKNNGNADHAAMQNVSLLRGYDGDPFAVDVPKLFLVCDPLIQGDQRFLIFRAALGVFYDGCGFVPVAAGLFLGDGRALAELFRLFADLFLERDVPCGERICVGLCVLLGTPQLKLLLV